MGVGFYCDLPGRVLKEEREREREKSHKGDARRRRERKEREKEILAVGLPHLTLTNFLKMSTEPFFYPL